MFKLEKELKSSELTNEDNDLLKEAKQLLLTQSVDEVELLDGLGLKNSIQVKRDKVQKLTRLETLQNDYGKIYTIKDIEKMALEYNLKFLKIERYDKEVPVYLATKLIEFRKKHENKPRFIGYSNADNLRNKTYILAPANHFRLEKDNTPLFDLSQMFVVDPAVFVEIDSDTNAEKFSLVYSWGDDLNLFNLISGHFNKNMTRIFLKNVLLSAPLIGFISAFLFTSAFGILLTTLIVSSMYSVILLSKYLGGNDDTFDPQVNVDYQNERGKKFWRSFYQNKRSVIFRFPWE